MLLRRVDPRKVYLLAEIVLAKCLFHYDELRVLARGQANVEDMRGNRPVDVGYPPSRESGLIGTSNRADNDAIKREVRGEVHCCSWRDRSKAKALLGFDNLAWVVAGTAEAKAWNARVIGKWNPAGVRGRLHRGRREREAQECYKGQSASESFHVGFPSLRHLPVERRDMSVCNRRGKPYRHIDFCMVKTGPRQMMTTWRTG